MNNADIRATIPDMDEFSRKSDELQTALNEVAASFGMRSDQLPAKWRSFMGGMDSAALYGYSLKREIAECKRRKISEYLGCSDEELDEYIRAGQLSLD